ncbi:hypothetical protein GmRootV118_27700 [Variovorax sp. V118]
MGAYDQHLGDALRRIAHLVEELVLAAHVAAVLARAADMFPHLLRQSLRRIELKDLRGVMIDPYDGVEERHGNPMQGMPNGRQEAAGAQTPY